MMNKSAVPEGHEELAMALDDALLERLEEQTVAALAEELMEIYGGELLAWLEDLREEYLLQQAEELIPQ